MHLAEAEFRVAMNFPFSGSFVPSGHYRREARVWSLMIEVKRSLYMEEASGKKSAEFDELRRKMRGFVAELARECERRTAEIDTRWLP